MFENEQKGSYGSYSEAGRNSVEKYHIVMQKDRILEGKTKKIKVQDFFSKEDEPTDIRKTRENQIDIFSLPPTMESDKKALQKLQKRKEVCEPMEILNMNEKFKYHKHHHKELNDYLKIVKKAKYAPSSTRYNPKMEFIWNRTITGPSWNYMSGRPENFLNRNNIENRFYLAHQELKPLGHIFINMDKQTQRGQIPTDYDVRIRYDKPFHSNEKNKKNNNTFSNISTNENSNNNINRSNSNNNISNSANKINLRKIKRKFDDIKAPDFSKKISREQLNFIHRDREMVRPFFNPKYKLVEPKCLTMVSYETSKKKTKVPKRPKGVDSNIIFDPDKFYYNINNNKRPIGPDFSKVVSRPNEKGPLPSYMIRKFDRESLYNTTDKSLKMNNYPNSGFLTEYSSFYPKKSFNKKINMNLLNSQNFLDNNMNEIMSQLKSNGNMNKIMEFYTKNLDDIQEDAIGTKIDSITLKTVPKKVQLSDREKAFFKIDFNQIDNDD